MWLVKRMKVVAMQVAGRKMFEYLASLFDYYCYIPLNTFKKTLLYQSPFLLLLRHLRNIIGICWSPFVPDHLHNPISPYIRERDVALRHPRHETAPRAPRDAADAALEELGPPQKRCSFERDDNGDAEIERTAVATRL